MCRTLEKAMTRLARPISLTTTLAVALSLLAAGAPAAAEPDPYATAVEWAQQIVAATQLPPPHGWTVAYECDTDARWSASVDFEVQAVRVQADRFDDPNWLAWSYVHEVGHVLDAERLQPEDRALWRGVRGISREPDWWSYGGVEPTLEQWATTPAEDFAEVFAACWYGHHPPEWTWRPSFAGRPGDGECEIMRGLTGVTPPARTPAQSAR